MVIEPSFRLHHVGYAVHDIESRASVYVRRYGYEFSTPIIYDQLQTAFVQFLKLPCDSVYLEFVAPDGPESMLVLPARRDNKLNHLCYSTDVLEEAMSHLENSGMRILSEPQKAVAFGGRRICWLIGEDFVPIELLERQDAIDLCVPGL